MDDDDRRSRPRRGPATSGVTWFDFGAWRSEVASSVGGPDRLQDDLAGREGLQLRGSARERPGWADPPGKRAEPQARRRTLTLTRAHQRPMTVARAAPSDARGLTGRCRSCAFRWTGWSARPAAVEATCGPGARSLRSLLHPPGSAARSCQNRPSGRIFTPASAPASDRSARPRDLAAAGLRGTSR